MEDKRNIIIAMIAAGLILFGWPYITNYFYPAPPQPRSSAATATTGTAPAAPASAAAGTASAPVAVGGAPGTATAPVSVAAARAATPRIPIETPALRGSINLKGARIDDITLVRFRQTVAENSPPVQLFAPGGTANSYFAGLGWNGAGLNAPTSETLWQAPAGARLTPTTPVTLTHDNGQGQVFSITYAIDANYMITATQAVTNRGAAPVGVSPFAFITRKGTSPDPDTWTIHSGVMGVFGGAPQWFDRDDIDTAQATRNAWVAQNPGTPLTEAPSIIEDLSAGVSTGGWAGFTDHFWLGAIIPQQSARVIPGVQQGAGGMYQVDFVTPETMLAAGGTRTVETRIFAGAKETRLLDAYTDGGITLFDRATDWGWFIWFVKPMFYVLDWLFRMIGNFGVAIMALTLIVRLIMFPIAQKQFSSMAQMRVLQPKLKALQERYADDKPKLQQEMMKLYKDEKINPLAGCLPILIQIPIFYGLYKALMLSVEMRHQPFALWIKDLSAPDPASLVTLAGYFGLPWPGILGLGVLAVLLGITMYLQFKLNPPPTDPIQQQVFAIMPWMLMFVMAPFAAGLLIYWITNNILTMAQQWWLYQRYPQMKQAMAST
ncbi:MAG: membrane protein insertase YidC [Sphingopyxis sp.]|nr:membrane protein insertase YidC [Sphingopyxis sp.]